MQDSQQQILGGERPLYKQHDTTILHVTIQDGESAIKEGRNIVVEQCTFHGKYALWEINKLHVNDCRFSPEARASLWYCHDVEIMDCTIEAPKSLREIHGGTCARLIFPNAEETFWQCSMLKLEQLQLQNADYCFMHSHDISIEDMQLQGNYPLQYVRNIEIHHAQILGRDAFWESENCTVFDSEIRGAYLGWYSKNLTLVRCRIAGTQPLCYAENLTLIDCTFDEDADLAFEYSSVQATINGGITSIVNPKSGKIVAEQVGEIISNDNNCAIEIG